MAQATIEFEGKPYVPSKQAAKETGYAQDYIGQLARSGAVLSRRVGGLWYVNLDALTEYKKNAEAYVPEPPASRRSEPAGSIVTFDGQEYISSKKAAEMTAYAQDYVGQLARSGKIRSRQMSGRWYVSKGDLLKHKQEKDALLAAVQSDAVGLTRNPAPVRAHSMQDLSSPLLSYHSATGDSLPSLHKKTYEKTIIHESRVDETDSGNYIQRQNSVSYPLEGAASDDENAIHHIAIRSMRREAPPHRVPSRSSAIAAQAQGAYAAHHGHWSAPVPLKRAHKRSYRALIPLLILVIGGSSLYYAGVSGLFSNQAVSGIAQGTLDHLSALFGNEKTYVRQ